MIHTTAEQLGRYYTELKRQGLPTDVCRDLVLDAGSKIHTDGIFVEDPDPATNAGNLTSRPQ